MGAIGKSSAYYCSDYGVDEAVTSPLKGLKLAHRNVTSQDAYQTTPSVTTVLAKSALEELLSLFVGAVQVATLHTASHQGSVRIFDDQVSFFFRQSRLLLHHFFPAANRFIVFVALIRGCHNIAITYDQVWADNDSDIVDFQTLAGMNAANLLDGVLSDDPQAAILIQVPLSRVVTDDDIGSVRIFLAQPRPTVARDYASLISMVFLVNGVMQRLR